MPRVEIFYKPGRISEYDVNRLVEGLPSVLAGAFNQAAELEKEVQAMLTSHDIEVYAHPIPKLATQHHDVAIYVSADDFQCRRQRKSEIKEELGLFGLLLGEG